MEGMNFTIREFIRHLLHLKRLGIITGDEELIDMGFFPITHVHVEKGTDGNAFVMLCSMEAEEAEMRRSYDEKI